MRWALETIRDAARLQLTMHEYLLANRRYKKCYRYFQFFCRQMPGDPLLSQREELERIVDQTSHNRSLCELKLCHWHECIALCERTLKQRPTLVQAFYRRGKAQLYLRNFDESLADLIQAERLAPRQPDIVEILAVARKHWQIYMSSRKQSLKGLFH